MNTIIDINDQQCLNKLLTENRNKVFNVIKNKVRNRDIAEDLLQDTFLEAHRCFHTFRKDSKFSTWVIGIAMNIIRNYYNRSPEYRYDFVDDSVVEFEACPTHATSNIENDLITQDLLGQTLDKMDALPCDLKEIFRLTVQENLAYKDIANMLDTSVSNIKVKIFRAREKLNNLFDLPVFVEAY